MIDKIPKSQRKEVMGDKGYKSKSNDAFLKTKGSKSRIMQKGYRNTRLSIWQKRYNRAISKTRWVVERTFGSMVRWFRAGIVRFKRKQKSTYPAHFGGNNVQFEAFSGIIVSKC